MEGRRRRRHITNMIGNDIDAVREPVCRICLKIIHFKVTMMYAYLGGFVEMKNARGE